MEEERQESRGKRYSGRQRCSHQIITHKNAPVVPSTYEDDPILILTITLRGRYYNSLHFTDEEPCFPLITVNVY